MEVEKRKLIKFSNYSLCITLPKWLITKLGWSKGDDVNVEVLEAEGKLIISRDKDQLSDQDSSGLRW